MSVLKQWASAALVACVITGAAGCAEEQKSFRCGKYDRSGNVLTRGDNDEILLLVFRGAGDEERRWTTSNTQEHFEMMKIYAQNHCDGDDMPPNKVLRDTVPYVSLTPSAP